MLTGIANGLRLYSRILLEARSPGEIIWEVFGERKGRLPLFRRDLICDWQTLAQLPRTGRSTDEGTMAFRPFIPLFRLNGVEWQNRRKVLRRAFEPQYVHRLKRHYPAPVLPEGLIDLYDTIFDACFEAGFHYLFGREASDDERGELLPGLRDLNRYVKRQVFRIDLPARQRLFDAVLRLTANKSETGFIFHDHEGFHALDPTHRASLAGSDLLFSCCVQPADMVAHMLVVRSHHRDAFDRASLEDSMNETLRLHPLSDIYARVPYDGARAWVASLVQLNRNGWDDPDRFVPDRWTTPGHPPNQTWGVEARRCPGGESGFAIAKGVFTAITSCQGLRIAFASDFRHERTFPYGLPAWISYGTEPAAFRMPQRWRRFVKRWIIERKRMIEQGEIW